MTASLTNSPHRPPRLRPVSAAPRPRSISQSVQSGAEEAGPSWTSRRVDPGVTADQYSIVSPPPRSPTSSSIGATSVPFTLSSALLRRDGLDQSAGGSKRAREQEQDLPAGRMRDAALQGHGEAEGEREGQANGGALFGPLPATRAVGEITAGAGTSRGIRAPKAEDAVGVGVRGRSGRHKGVTVAGAQGALVDSPDSLSTSASLYSDSVLPVATNQHRTIRNASNSRDRATDASESKRDSFVLRIIGGLARRHSNSTGSHPSAGAATSPPLSPVLQVHDSGPNSPSSIRSPTALPSPTHPRVSSVPASPYAAVASPTSSPPPPRAPLRDDTPIPSPPSSSLAQPTYSRPRPFRTLSWSFLPSRSARTVANRQPIVDRELNEEERQWVEKAAEVPDDGMTRDRWDNPIGRKGDWGRTVLSPIVTETETSSSSHPHPAARSSSSVRPTSSENHYQALPVSSSSRFSPRTAAISPTSGWSRENGGIVSPPLVPLPGALPASDFTASPRSIRERSSSSHGSTPLTASRQRQQPQQSPGTRATPRTAPRTTAPLSKQSTRAATPSSASSVTKLGNRSPWLDGTTTTTVLPDSSNSDDERHFSTPPTSPASILGTHSSFADGPRKSRLSPGTRNHDYHSLSTIQTSRATESIRPPSHRRTGSAEVVEMYPSGEELGPTAYRSNGNTVEAVRPLDVGFDDYLLYSPPRPPLAAVDKLPSNLPSFRASASAPLSRIPSAPSPQATTSTRRKADSIARWRAAVIPASTSEHAPDLSGNGFSFNESRLGATSSIQHSPDKQNSLPSRREASSLTGGHTWTVPSSARSTSTHPSARRGDAIIPDEVASEPLSLPFSPPPSSPEQHGMPSARNVTEVSPSIYTTSHPDHSLEGEDADPRNSIAVGNGYHPWSAGEDPLDGFEQRYPPPSPAYRSTEPTLSSNPPKHALPDLAEWNTPAPPGRRGVGSFPQPPTDFDSPPWSSKARVKRPPRQGAFPVPELTAAERATRRALRKDGRSPEHHLPHEATKAGRRKQAWMERQAFEAERDRLLGLLSSSDDYADRSADPVHQLGVEDVPTLNQLSELHLGTSIQATQEAGLYYLQLSLRLDEAQPREAHKLALLIEERDIEEAIYWHQAAVRHAPDDPDYLLHLSNAYRTVGNVDSAAHAFGELSQRFRNTPYEAIAWYKLARLFEDCEAPDERAEAHQSFRAYYECLERLSQIALSERPAGPWSTLGQVEEGTLFGLGLFGDTGLQHLPRLFSTEIWSDGLPPEKAYSAYSVVTSPSFGRSPSRPSSPMSPLAPPPGLSSPRFAAAVTTLTSSSPNDPPPMSMLSEPDRSASGTIRRATRIESQPGDAPRLSSSSGAPPLSSTPLERRSKPTRRTKVDPLIARTLDTVLKGLQTMSRAQDAASLAASTQHLAEQVESAFLRMSEAKERETDRHEELFRLLDQVHRDLTRLPDRVISSAKLRASRPPGIQPILPSPDPVESALRRVEQARLLSVQPPR
ncbi:hypothetical protein JCM10908_001778 [Rhodotorula pacifica]|uniref:uncharacterized protein n=1 Tax=Rhodotorula pacifica TaxID=1495444 RepID=UPI00316DE805